VDAAQTEADAKKAAAEEKIKKYGTRGYKPQVHNGNTVYCREEVSLGSRFKTQQCRTYDQLLADEKTGIEYTKSLQAIIPQSRN
jgi:hypothetical protein